MCDILSEWEKIQRPPENRMFLNSVRIPWNKHTMLRMGVAMPKHSDFPSPVRSTANVFFCCTRVLYMTYNCVSRNSKAMCILCEIWAHNSSKSQTLSSPILQATSAAAVKRMVAHGFVLSEVTFTTRARCEVNNRQVDNMAEMGRYILRSDWICRDHVVNQEPFHANITWMCR